MSPGDLATDVVVLAGGSPHAHDFAASGAAVCDLLTDHGYRPILVSDPDAAAAAIGNDVAALVVLGLWWQMHGEAYDEWRDAHGYSTPESTRQAIAGFIHGGGGLVALHTAVICFDDWPAWGEVVGGSWRWGVSSHPPLGPVSARLIGQHPVISGSPRSIELDDEVYGDLDLSETVEVLAVAQRHPGDAEQPVLWAHQFGDGRVVFNGFGHDVDSVTHTDNARLITRALDWVAGRP